MAADHADARRGSQSLRDLGEIMAGQRFFRIVEFRNDPQRAGPAILSFAVGFTFTRVTSSMQKGSLDLPHSFAEERRHDRGERNASHVFRQTTRFT